MPSEKILLEIVTNLNTRFLVLPLRSETVGDVRDTIKSFHMDLFPTWGEVDVSVLEVKCSTGKNRITDCLSILELFWGARQGTFFAELIPLTTKPIELRRLNIAGATGANVVSKHELHQTPAESTPSPRRGLVEGQRASSNSPSDAGKRQVQAECAAVDGRKPATRKICVDRGHPVLELIEPETGVFTENKSVRKSMFVVASATRPASCGRPENGEQLQLRKVSLPESPDSDMSRGSSYENSGQSPDQVPELPGDYKSRTSHGSSAESGHPSGEEDDQTPRKGRKIVFITPKDGSGAARSIGRRSLGGSKDPKYQHLLESQKGCELINLSQQKSLAVAERKDAKPTRGNVTVGRCVRQKEKRTAASVQDRGKDEEGLTEKGLEPGEEPPQARSGGSQNIRAALKLAKMSAINGLETNVETPSIERTRRKKGISIPADATPVTRLTTIYEESSQHEDPSGADSVSLLPEGDDQKVEANLLLSPDQIMAVADGLVPPPEEGINKLVSTNADENQIGATEKVASDSDFARKKQRKRSQRVGEFNTEVTQQDIRSYMTREPSQGLARPKNAGNKETSGKTPKKRKLATDHVAVQNVVLVLQQDVVSKPLNKNRDSNQDPSRDHSAVLPEEIDMLPEKHSNADGEENEAYEEFAAIVIPQTSKRAGKSFKVSKKARNLATPLMTDVKAGRGWNAAQDVPFESVSVEPVQADGNAKEGDKTSQRGKLQQLGFLREDGSLRKINSNSKRKVTFSGANLPGKSKAKKIAEGGTGDGSKRKAKARTTPAKSDKRAKREDCPFGCGKDFLKKTSAYFRHIKACTLAGPQIA